MLNAQALADRYVAAWNEPDAAKRASAIAALWTTDPSATAGRGIFRAHQAHPHRVRKGRGARGHSLSRRPNRPPPRRRRDVPLGDAARRERDCAGGRARVPRRRRRRSHPRRPSVRSRLKSHPPLPTPEDKAHALHHGKRRRRALLARVGSGARRSCSCSLGCDSRMSDYQIAAFADEGFRCIGFGRRGHGRSEQPAGGYDFDTFADDVALARRRPRPLGPHPRRPFDGGRRGGAYLTGTEASASRGLFLVAPTTPMLLKTTTIPTACPWKPSRRCGRGGDTTIRNGSTTMSGLSSSGRRRPRWCAGARPSFKLPYPSPSPAPGHGWKRTSGRRRCEASTFPPSSSTATATDRCRSNSTG